MNEQNNANWYAIYVAGGQEEAVKESLEVHFAEQLQFYVFKRILRERKDGQWREVERKLFPGYVLANGVIDIELYHRMKSVQSNCRLIRDKEVPLFIGEHELEVLGLLARETDGEIGISSIYQENDVVIVVDGPLMGLEGLIISIDSRKGRAKVALEFLGDRRVVELGIRVVEKV